MLTGPRILPPQAPRTWHPAWRLCTYSLRWLLAAEAWMALWGAYMALCVGTLASVGLLLGRQLRLLCRGQTHLQAMQRQWWWKRNQEFRHPSQPSDQEQQGQQQQEQQQQQAGELETSSTSKGSRVGGVAAAAPAAAAAAHARRWAQEAMANAWRVFDEGHPLTWLLPPGWGLLGAGHDRSKQS